MRVGERGGAGVGVRERGGARGGVRREGRWG